MKFLIENKITIIICGSILLLGLFIAYFYNKKDLNNNDKSSYKYSSYLKNYQINELTPMYINEELMASKYLAEYTKLIINNPQLAYDLVDKEYCEKKFDSLDKFKTYFNAKFDANFFDAKVVQLEIKKISNYKEFYIIDSSDNTYIFREYSIMQYKVLFDDYTI